MQYHLLAYALVVLFREANTAVPEVATAEVSTLRSQLFKVGAVVNTSLRRIWFHFSSSWPRRKLFAQICEAVDTRILAPAALFRTIPRRPLPRRAFKLRPTAIPQAQNQTRFQHGAQSRLDA